MVKNFPWKKWVHTVPEEVWAISDKTDRLEALKKFLGELGVPPAQVALITPGSMDSAYAFHLHSVTKNRIEARRAANSSSLRKRARTNNAAAATALGLGGGALDLVDEHGVRDGDEGKAGDAPFSMEVVAADVSKEQAQLVQRSPVCSIVFKGVEFDPSLRPLAVIAIPTNGSTTVSEPELTSVDGTNLLRHLHLEVTRTNAPDFLENIFPDYGHDKHMEILDKMDLANTYGKHIDYDVINSMCQQIAPPKETWNVEVEFQTPYYLKDENSITILHSDSANVCLLFCALECVAEVREKKKVKVITLSDIV